MSIQKVAVIGAGVMGASIAALITNGGIPVYLFDIVPEGASNRNSIAENAVKKLLEAEPAAFMDKANAKLISTGNIEDDLPNLADADWVIEAVIENLQVKQSLYQKLNTICKAECLISSNTSTLPLAMSAVQVAEVPSGSGASVVPPKASFRLLTTPGIFDLSVALKKGA